MIATVKLSKWWFQFSYFQPYFFRNCFVQAFFHWHLFFYFISNNNCRLLTINIVSFIFFQYRESKPPFCLHYEKSSPWTSTFVICRHPVTLFTRYADWHKLAGYWFILRFCEHFTCLSSIPSTHTYIPLMCVGHE
jgi:hypothetical protein